MGSRGGAVPSGAASSGLRRTGGFGVRGGARVVVQRVRKLEDTGKGEGEVTGGDHERAALSGMFWFVP